MYIAVLLHFLELIKFVAFSSTYVIFVDSISSNKSVETNLISSLKHIQILIVVLKINE